MKFPILDFNEKTGESNEDDNFNKIFAKLAEEYIELIQEIEADNPTLVAEEAQDLIQVLIRLLIFLERKKCIHLGIANELHNEKLKKRGWITEGYLEIEAVYK